MSTLPPLLLVLRAALRGEPAEVSQEPWLAWLALALCRQRVRQDWWLRVAQERLQGCDEEEGTVPGLPDWSFSFHGQGLCLTGPDNEVLDVDFRGAGETARTIDPHFFITRVLALKPKPKLERRLERWFRGERDLLVAALDQLRDHGLITHPSSRHVFHLHPWLEANHVALAAVDLDEAGVLEDWARRLGDVEGAEEAFIRWALSLLEDRKKARVIEALAPRLTREQAERACLKLLEGPVDFVTGKALRVLRELGVAPGPEAFALMSRLDPETHNPFSACELAEWLLLHGQREEGMALVRRFAAQRKSPGFGGNPFDDDYAILALRFAPDEALPLVEQALRSRTPNAVRRVSALLSLLDEPWCRAAMLAAAQEVEDRTSQRVILGCLLHSADAETRERAMALIPPPPNFDDGKPGYSHEQVSFLNLRGDVEYQRERMRKVVGLVRPC